MIAFILRTGYEHFFDNGRLIRPALGAGGFKGAEGQLLTAGAFDHNALGTPPVDLAHRYVLNLVVRLDAFYKSRHGTPLLSPGCRPFRVLTREHMCCRNTANNLVPVLLSLSPLSPDGHQARKGSNILTLTRRVAHEVNHPFLSPATSLGSSEAKSGISGSPGSSYALGFREGSFSATR